MPIGSARIGCAAMKQVADGVWHLDTFFLPNAINAFLVDDVLIDAGTRHSATKILKQLQGHEVKAHALTHAHPDHQGASHELCENLGIPFWVGENDVDAAENPELIRERQPANAIARFYIRIFMGPGHPVDRRLHEYDQVASFEVVDVPGHSAGHIAFWRESDGVLILGDVLANIDQLTGIPGLHEPKPYLTPDPEENRRSARKLAELEPKIVLFGHGAPIRDTRKFVEFVAGLDV
jgi:glyoxylase-like metal-dependent hydrolase (beta-lactamase superfamily II)